MKTFAAKSCFLKSTKSGVFVLLRSILSHNVIFLDVSFFPNPIVKNYFELKVWFVKNVFSKSNNSKKIEMKI